MTFEALRGQTVLVTGGTGFIGGRLVERLCLEHGANVRVLVRRFGRAAARIGRLPVQLISGDVSNPADVLSGMQGCAYVFHCAYANEGGEKAQHRINVGGTRAVLTAARRVQPRRVVHVSTMAVYGHNTDPVLTENAPYGNSSDPYGRTKRLAEKLALAESARHAIPVTVVQPSIVYGPYGGAWTYGPLQRLRANRLYLPRQGMGICNLVYVDDVVEAMLLCATHSAAVGERFLVSGQAITWRAFYAYFEAMLGHQAIELHPPPSAWQWPGWGRVQAIRHELGAIWQESPRRQERWTRILKLTGLQSIQRWLPETAWERLKSWAVNISAGNERILHQASQLPPLIQPQGYEAYLYDKQGEVSVEKIHQKLGYSFRVNPEIGMARTHAWAKWANLVPNT